MSLTYDEKHGFLEDANCVEDGTHNGFEVTDEVITVSACDSNPLFIFLALLRSHRCHRLG